MKACPHCGARTLPWGDLATLSARTPWICPNCDGLVSNTMFSALLPAICFISGIAVTAALARAFEASSTIIVVVGAVLSGVVAQVAAVLWVKPIPIIPDRRGCAACHRLDVGYLSPGDTVCAGCQERIEFEKVMAEQRELESRPGYRATEATRREVERLQRWDRRPERPNEEL
jgi:hypothetical protein